MLSLFPNEKFQNVSLFPDKMFSVYTTLQQLSLLYLSYKLNFIGKIIDTQNYIFLAIKFSLFVWSFTKFHRAIISLYVLCYY